MLKFSALAALCGGLVLSAAVPAAAAPGDQIFVTNAAMGGMAEVNMARLALSKSTSPKVLAFARRMIGDHTPNNALLAMTARRDGYRVPASIGAANAITYQHLSALHGAAFDSAYWSAQVSGHETMLNVMQTEAASHGDPHLVAFARTTIPTVKSHLAMARMDSMRGMM